MIFGTLEKIDHDLLLVLESLLNVKMNVFGESSNVTHSQSNTEMSSPVSSSKNLLERTGDHYKKYPKSHTLKKFALRSEVVANYGHLSA